MAGLSRETMRQIELLMQPFVLRQRNMIARAQVLLVDDGLGLQSLQIAAPETVPDGEHYQPYGISGVPPVGSEAIVLFPGGDRGHPLVFGVSHRASRPIGGEPGEFTIYNGLTGAKVVLTKDGDVVATPAPGRRMLVDDGSGAAALPTMADFNGIISIMNSAGTGAATALPAAVASYQAAHPTWPDGTKVLEAK